MREDERESTMSEREREKRRLFILTCFMVSAIICECGSFEWAKLLRHRFWKEVVIFLIGQEESRGGIRIQV